MKFRLFIILSFTMFATTAFAQEGKIGSKFDFVTISTSTVCDMCVATIEKGFHFEKGVKGAEVNLDSNTVTVQYKKGKTDPEAIKKALTMMGYSADEMPPNPDAYDSLHHCCKADFDHGND